VENYTFCSKNEKIIEALKTKGLPSFFLQLANALNQKLKQKTYILATKVCFKNPERVRQRHG
jgi:hypothetical protein